MKSLIIFAMVILMTSPTLWAKNIFYVKDYVGEIEFKDGSTVEYNEFYCVETREVPYSRDIKDLQGDTHYWSNLRFSAISRIDFFDLTDTEKSIAKKYQPYSFEKYRKAKITFRDRTIYDNVYLYCGIWEYRGHHEEGTLANPRIKGLTINLKQAKQCPKCSRQFKEKDWKFCPYDGTPLK